MPSLPRDASPPETEVSAVRGELTDTEWTFRDGRHRAFLLHSGRGVARIADGEIPFVAPALLWLPPDAAARVLLGAGTRGLSLAITEVGLARAIPAGAISAQMRAVLAQPRVHARLDAREVRRVEEMLTALADEARSDRPGAQDAVRHLLALTLILVWRLSGPVLRESRPLPRTIAQRFLHAVEVHLREHWTVARHAAEIGIGPDRLSATVRRITGRSPLELIHARIIHEADALLDDSSLQIAEIAEELGFSDPAYFSRFYKRLTGHPPNRQRREPRAGPGRSSFAAWP